MFSGTAQVSHQVFSISLSVLRVFVCVRFVCVCVTTMDKNKAVVCCLLVTSAIMLSEKKKRERKMWSKQWYFKRNVS